MADKFYSRPKDRSLQAYKDWINGVMKRLIPDAKDTLTEEEWVEKWKGFWSKAKGNKNDTEVSSPEK